MKILITGGTGSLGSALVEKWASENEIVIVSRDDIKQAALRERFPSVVCFSLDIGNSRNASVLESICSGCDLCIHAAAQKVVSEGQYQPEAYVTTNVLGTQNMLRAWKETHGDCRAFLLISTDKAVAPLNHYGATKKVAEGLVRQEIYNGLCLRYGNVVESKGAFVAKWKQAKASGEPILVRMGVPSGETPTRFFLTMGDAVGLVESVIECVVRGGAKPGIYVPTGLRAFDVMDAASMTGLEVVAAPISGYEKLHEVLLAPGEGISTVGKNIVRVEPSFWPGPGGDNIYKGFSSNLVPRMTGEEVLDMVGW